jgi:type I restriction enzyme S subunit
VSPADLLKETELGRLPVDWPVVTLGSLSEITSSKRVFQRQWRSSGVPFYRARELAVLSEQGYVENELFIEADMYEGYARKFGAPGEGDLLITGVGTLGKTYVVKADERFYFKDGNIIWLKRAKGLDPTFLEQLYRTPALRNQVLGESAGTTVGTYTITNAKNTKIPFPPLLEQKRIASALSDADSLVRSLERLILKKRAIRQGILQELLTGRTRLAGFTDDWVHLKLGSLGLLLKGRGVRRDDVREVGIPCIRYGELYTVFRDYTHTVESHIDAPVAATALPIRTGDLLFAGSGETREEIGMCVAYVGDRPAVAGGDIIVLRGSDFNPVYLACLLNTPAVAAQKARLGQGDAVVHISSRALASIDVTLPKRDEQDAVAEVLVDTNLELGSLEAQLAKARDVKQGMMQELLTGRTRLMPRKVSA